jgi:hypothetical protein
MRKTCLRKQTKSSIGKLKRKLWKLFSEYIRKRDGNRCFICNRTATGSAYHAGHFIPKSVGGLILYFHEKNVHGCCYHCNINLGGNLYEYGQKLGGETVKELYALKGKIEKWSAEDYLNKIAHYTALLATKEFTQRGN